MTYDSWDLHTLREAAAYRTENPDPQWADADAYMDSLLAEAEAQRLHTTATPVADEEPATRRPGSTSYRADPASPKQLSFIASLVSERRLDPAAWVPADKRAASAMIEKLLAMKTAPAVRMASEKQRELIANLLTERAYGAEVDVATLSMTQASELIDALFAAPRAKVAAHGIRTGRYAFQPEGAPAQFYRVGRNGRITVQAGPSEHPYNGQLNEALLAIKEDPKAAAELYGRLLGHCGRCGLELTDETSRALGLGPICANKEEW
jgi:hypothetical protein